jgi:hypothetical protein
MEVYKFRNYPMISLSCKVRTKTAERTYNRSITYLGEENDD